MACLITTVRDLSFPRAQSGRQEGRRGGVLYEGGPKSQSDTQSARDLQLCVPGIVVDEFPRLFNRFCGIIRRAQSCGFLMPFRQLDDRVSV